MEKLIERHFTRADIQAKLLKVFSPIGESEIVRVKNIKLLSVEGGPPLWFCQCERQLSPLPSHSFTCVVCERVFNGKPYLDFPSEESLPFGLSSPAEEDAEIERARRKARELRIAAESAEVQA